MKSLEVYVLLLTLCLTFILFNVGNWEFTLMLSFSGMYSLPILSFSPCGNTVLNLSIQSVSLFLRKAVIAESITPSLSLPLPWSFSMIWTEKVAPWQKPLLKCSLKIRQVLSFSGWLMQVLWCRIRSLNSCAVSPTYCSRHFLHVHTYLYYP